MPEKLPENILTRYRNRSVALSVKDIHQATGSRRILFFFSLAVIASCKDWSGVLSFYSFSAQKLSAKK